MENIQEMLEKLMLESERVQITTIALNEWQKIPQIFEDFMKEIDNAGPNPLKEF